MMTRHEIAVARAFDALNRERAELHDKVVALTRERDAAVLAEREAAAGVVAEDEADEHCPMTHKPCLRDCGEDCAENIAHNADLNARACARILPSAASSLPPEPPPGTVRVRIACKMDERGRWRAQGQFDWSDDVAAKHLTYGLIGRPRLSWIIADVSKPEASAEVRGVVS